MILKGLWRHQKIKASTISFNVCQCLKIQVVFKTSVMLRRFHKFYSFLLPAAQPDQCCYSSFKDLYSIPPKFLIRDTNPTCLNCYNFQSSCSNLVLNSVGNKGNPHKPANVSKTGRILFSYYYPIPTCGIVRYNNNNTDDILYTSVCQ